MKLKIHKTKKFIISSISLHLQSNQMLKLEKNTNKLLLIWDSKDLNQFLKKITKDS